MNKTFIIKQLKLGKQEINKRYNIFQERGVDLANYENNFLKIFENFIVKHFQSHGVDKNVILDELSYWLYEENHFIWLKSKPNLNYTIDDSGINKYKIDITKPKHFYKYLLTCK